MPTVNYSIAKVIMDNNGIYPGDEQQPPVISVTRYNNMFDGKEAFGLTYQGQVNSYINTPQCRNAKVIWSRKENSLT